jgi:hypothetical protein
MLTPEEQSEYAQRILSELSQAEFHVVTKSMTDKEGHHDQ